MRRIILTLLATVIVLGLFAVAGYAGYRFGFAEGLRATIGEEERQLRPFEGFERRGLPDFGFERGLPRALRPARFPGVGFGLFWPLMFLGQIVLLALIVGFLFWLVARSGWRLTRQTTENLPPHPENE
jgi:hypothetical protein